MNHSTFIQPNHSTETQPSDDLEIFFLKCVEKTDPTCFQNSLDKFWASVEDGSIFEDKEFMEMAQKIIQKNPNLMDNI